MLVASSTRLLLDVTWRQFRGVVVVLSAFIIQPQTKKNFDAGIFLFGFSFREVPIELVPINCLLKGGRLGVVIGV